MQVSAPSDTVFVDIDQERIERIAAAAGAGIDDAPLEPRRSPRWAGLRGLGTALWLDSGDIDEVDELWTSEFEALTTNNTLLNKEIQKGIYDDYVHEQADLVSGLPDGLRVLEMGFLLNARHGLRLVRRYGARVSVELSTELAHDVDGSVFYGRRFHAISPEHFVVKVPLTAAGLLAARQLVTDGIPVNFTLGFSARHNHLIAGFVRPEFVNVFLGRCNGYVEKNGLGSGELVGEKALLASQRCVAHLYRESPGRPRQIAASMREPEQVARLAGCDVMTMPTAVARGVDAWDAIDWQDRSGDDPEPGIDAAPTERLACFWEVGEADRRLLQDLQRQAPESPEELIAKAHACGLGDCFPELTATDEQRIADDGKIPDHGHWCSRIADGLLAPDTLLNKAGLAAFAADQRALDERLRSHLG
ncbi:MAG: transaldolase family protein [Planctomycetota bacterium]